MAPQEITMVMLPPMLFNRVGWPRVGHVTSLARILSVGCASYAIELGTTMLDVMSWSALQTQVPPQHMHASGKGKEHSALPFFVNN